MGLQHYTQDMSKIPLKYHKKVFFCTNYTHPTLICRGTHGRTHAQKIFTQYSGISSCSVGSTYITITAASAKKILLLRRLPGRPETHHFPAGGEVKFGQPGKSVPKNSGHENFCPDHEFFWHRFCHYRESNQNVWAGQPDGQVGRKSQSWILVEKLSKFLFPEYNPSLSTAGFSRNRDSVAPVQKIRCTQKVPYIIFAISLIYVKVRYVC